MQKRLYLWLCLTLLSLSVWAQTPYRVGMLPQVNFNSALKSDWGLNSKIESRQIFRQGILNHPEFEDYDYVLTDISAVLTHKLFAGSTLAGGYLIRVREQAWAHRFIQQYSFVNKYAAFRLGHRILSDQTISTDDPTVFRFRYRIGIDLAIKGQKVDPGEWYFKLTHEYLNSLSEGDYDLELRLGPTLGHAFTDNNKLEIGLDYRLDSLLSGPMRHSLWLKFAWYIKYP